MDRTVFPKDFIFGAATASYQVEGAGDIDGRTSCIWDDYAKIPGKVYCGENGAVSVDQYHRYQEDVALMGNLGLGAYRFSVSWPRVLPHGKKEINPKGIQYYKNLIAELHKHGMKAVCTLYHWDLPSELEENGGWANRETAYAFRDYAETIFKELGDSVDMWITINEPFCITYLGYLWGNQAPGKTDKVLFEKAVHHVNLAHGLAVESYRKTGLKAPIGIAWNPITPRPATLKDCDKLAALHARALNTEIFTGPVMGYGYPEYATKEMQMAFPIEQGDMELISLPIDFYAVNYYNERPVKDDPKNPRGFSDAENWEKETSSMHWPINEKGLLRILCWLNDYTKGLPCIISENGAAENDELEPTGRVRDLARIDYIKKHLHVCGEAIQEGIPLKGYLYWSLIDNYEWSFGYTKRFGLVYCDYFTLDRYPKDSAYFMRDVITGYAEF